MKSTPLCLSIVTAVCAFTVSAQAGGHQGSQAFGSASRSQANSASQSDHLMTSKSMESPLFDSPKGGSTQAASHFIVAPWLQGLLGTSGGSPRPNPADTNPQIMGHTGPSSR